MVLIIKSYRFRTHAWSKRSSAINSALISFIRRRSIKSLTNIAWERAAATFNTWRIANLGAHLLTIFNYRTKI